MARKAGPSIDHPTLDYVSHVGPHRVASGILEPSGLPGLVFAPVSGRDLPVVAFGHGWLQPVSRYTGLMRYLASWGIIVVAPATERGPVPSYSGLGTDLSRALRAATTTGQLSGGIISGDPARFGVLGHSLGGGAAVLAAAADSAIKAVVTVTPAITKPALRAAGSVTTPGLHLVGPTDGMAGEAGRQLAESWAGPVQLRSIKGTKHFGLTEGRHWTTTLTGDGKEKDTQHAARVASVAFFLRHLADQDQLAEAFDGPIAGSKIVDLEEPPTAS